MLLICPNHSAITPIRAPCALLPSIKGTHRKPVTVQCGSVLLPQDFWHWETLYPRVVWIVMKTHCSLWVNVIWSVIVFIVSIFFPTSIKTNAWCVDKINIDWPSTWRSSSLVTSIRMSIVFKYWESAHPRALVMKVENYVSRLGRWAGRLRLVIPISAFHESHQYGALN